MIQNKAVALLEFYLHMITRSFELHYSVVARRSIGILGHGHHPSSTYLKLTALRSELRNPLAGVEPSTIRLPAAAEPGVVIPSREMRYRKAGSSKSFVAVAAVGVLYVSSTAFMPGANCVPGRCSVPDNYAFLQFVRLLAPAVLLAALICLLIAVLIRAIPQANTLDVEPDPQDVEPRTLDVEPDPPTTSRPADLAIFMRPPDPGGKEALNPSR
ncbi:hypothetical protein [Rathayibacter soli]|uniref:hypothetical protein n=1 Tax=Rathayibacter soli TaxID=3144168 RepID=UPI0027E462CF|nr:hypothetical protein [Glaciibacter superstes]